MNWWNLGAALSVASASLAVEIPFQERTVGSAENEVQNVVTIDFDDDGDLDVISGSAVENRIVFFESDGASPPVFTRRNIIADAPGVASVDVVDVDGDGDLDVVAATGSDRTVSWYEREPGKTVPTFTRRVAFTIPDPANISRAIVADVNGDGNPDFVYGGLTRFGWLENDGEDDPEFTDRQITTTNLLPQGFVVADLNADGDRDIVLCGTLGENRLVWLESDGADPPVFTEHEIETVLTTPRSLVVADMNRDQVPDIVVASSASDSLAWYESSGGGLPEFTERLVTETVSSARAVVAADLDSNGFIDLVVSSTADDKVMWYDSDGASTPVFTEREVMSMTLNAPREIVATDADGDSDPDIVVANSGADTVLYFANELAPVRNLTLGRVYQSISEALLEARSDDEITAAAFQFDDEDAINFRRVGATLRSSGAILQPKAAEYTLADGARLAATSPNAITLVGLLSAPLGAQAELGGAGVTIAPSAIVSVEPGAELVLDASAPLSNAGMIDILGGSLLTDGAMLTFGDLSIIQGVLSADTLDNSGAISGSADIFADVTNAKTGDLSINADSLIAGALTNDGTVTVQSGVLTVLGTLTNNGTIVGTGGARGAQGDGFFVSGSLALGADSSLMLPAGDSGAVGGDFDAAINDSARFDLVDAELRLAGLGDVQRVEAMSADIGPDAQGLTRGAGRFPIGAFSVGLTPCGRRARRRPRQRRRAGSRGDLHQDPHDLSGRRAAHGRRARVLRIADAPRDRRSAREPHPDRRRDVRRGLRRRRVRRVARPRRRARGVGDDGRSGRPRRQRDRGLGGSRDRARQLGRVRLSQFPLGRPFASSSPSGSRAGGSGDAAV